MAKTLIAYFSHAEKNYTHGGIGYLEVGNTEVVAMKLHKLVESDLFYIDIVKSIRMTTWRRLQQPKRSMKKMPVLH